MYHFSSTATGDQVSSEDIRCKITAGYEGKITFSEAAKIHWPQNITHFGPCYGYKHIKLLLKSLIIYSKNFTTRIKHDLYSAAPQILENIELRVKKLHRQITLKKTGAWNSPVFYNVFGNWHMILNLFGKEDLHSPLRKHFWENAVSCWEAGALLHTNYVIWSPASTLEIQTQTKLIIR